MEMKMEESSLIPRELMEQMRTIYEEREQEYQKLNLQHQQREAELTRIGQEIVRQKEEIEKKEQYLQEYEKRLTEIKNGLEERTRQLQEDEETFERLAAEQKVQAEQAQKTFEQTVQSLELKKQMEISQLQNQRLVLEREHGEVQLLKQKLSFGSTADPEKAEKEIAELRDQCIESQRQLEESQKRIKELEEASGTANGGQEEIIRQLQNEKAEQLRKIMDLKRQLREKEEKNEQISPESLKLFLEESQEFSNADILHAQDGNIVTARRGNVTYRFALKEYPFFDLCVAREETEELKETIYQLNRKSMYKFFYDQERREAVLTGYFLPGLSHEEMVHLALEAAQYIAAE